MDAELPGAVVGDEPLLMIGAIGGGSGGPCILGCMQYPAKSDGLTLAECTLHLECGRRSGDYLCRVSFDLHRTDVIVIESLESVAASFSNCGFDDSFFVSSPSIREPIECFVNSTSRDSNGGFKIKLMPKRAYVFVDQSRPLVRVTAGVVNLGHYGHKRPLVVRQFTLTDYEWSIDFTPALETILQYPPEIQNAEYFFTHQIELRKKSGSSFSAIEARDELNLLCGFLSFCHGFWVSTALTCGMDEEGVVAMEEWGIRQVSPWHRGTNWLDECNGTCMVELYPLFVERMRDPDWCATIKQTIYWNHRSEMTFVGPDGGCILLQTVLERLAWQLFVIDKRSLSEEGFSKLPAADQLRLLISASSIPLEIPPQLTDLQKAAKEFNWNDGPQAFVTIRNRLVHPPKTKGSLGKEWPYYEAYLLGKWYLDLVILNTCKYKGLYANRTKIPRSVGEVERVPWAS